MTGLPVTHLQCVDVKIGTHIAFPCECVNEFAGGARASPDWA